MINHSSDILWDLCDMCSEMKCSKGQYLKLVWADMLGWTAKSFILTAENEPILIEGQNTR